MANSRIVHDLYQMDPALGIDGGGGFDLRVDFYPISFGMVGLPLDAPRWGAEYKQMLHEYYTRSLYMLAHTTQLPVATNTVTLDPTVKDPWGLPAVRVTFEEHANDMKLYHYMLDRGMDWLAAAGATKRWPLPIDPRAPFLPAVHLLGTCRMGNDPRTRVVDRYHRAHDVPNLFIVDGSSFVTSGRGQPTLTIQALAFRAAAHMTRQARE